MKAEAAANADSDKAAREKAEAINQADSLIFQTEKQLSEFGDKIPADKAVSHRYSTGAIEGSAQNQDVEAIQSTTKTLNDAFMAASQDIYNASRQREVRLRVVHSKGSPVVLMTLPM